MPLYGKMLKLAELSHFLADFGPVQKTMVLAVKFEPLDQTILNFKVSNQKNLLTSGENIDSMVMDHGMVDYII